MMPTMHRPAASSQEGAGTNRDAQRRRPQACRRCGSRLGAAAETSLLRAPRTRTALAVNSARHDSQLATHLDIDELDKGKAPARSRDLVLDEDDAPHAPRAVLARPRARLHGLRDRLRPRERVEPAEEQHGSLRVPDVPRAVVRGAAEERLPAVAGRGALGVVDLHPAPVRRRGAACLERTVERGGRGRAVRGGRRDLDEGEAWVHKGVRVLGARELGEAETLRDTCHGSSPGAGWVYNRDTGERLVRGRGRKETSMRCRTLGREMGQVPVDLSRIMVTDSMLQPLLVR